MPFMVIDGRNIKIDNNTFDAINQFIQDDTQTSSEEKPRRQSRSRDAGTYDITTLDTDSFKKYCLNRLKTLFTCPDCGTTISNNTNLSKHNSTKKCRNSQNFCWNVDLKLHSKSPQHLTTRKIILEELLPHYSKKEKWRRKDKWH